MARAKNLKIAGRPKTKTIQRTPEFEAMLNVCRRGREEKNLTQRQIGAKMGMTREAVNNIEGRTRNVVLPTFVKYAEACGYNITIVPKEQSSPDERTYIYVAGPMRAHLEKGIHDACKIGDVLLKAGIIPFLPQVQALWNMITPHENDEEIYRVRLPFDYAWIDKCHGVLRLPGISAGSDKEVVYTKSKGKPVFYAVDEVLAFDVERRHQRTA